MGEAAEATPTSDSARSFNVNTDGIVPRSAAFADRIIKLTLALPSNVAGWELGRQLIRAGTSIGANVEEAQAAESRADFIHKLRVARKECRETSFFLVRVANAELVAPERLTDMIDESQQLLRMLTAIIRGTMS